MKNYIKISFIFSMLAILILTSNQSAFAAQNRNAKQVQLNINGIYAIVSINVYGDNQWGNRTYWPPKDPNAFYLQTLPGSAPIYPYTCKYGESASNCPKQMKTTGYWWTGIVTINFEVYTTLPLPQQVGPFQKSLKKVSCTMPIDEKAWGDTLTLTFDAGSNNASGPTVTEYYNGKTYVTVTSCQILK